MTDAPSAFKATFSDWRTVKGRKQLQLIFEVPLEQQEQVLTILGAPSPSDPAWCGIALLDKKALQGSSEPVPSISGRERRNWNELPPATQAGIRCGEAAFQKFLCEAHPLLWEEAAQLYDDASETAGMAVRRMCDVDSRADIKTDERSGELWRRLNDRYDAWRLV